MLGIQHCNLSVAIVLIYLRMAHIDLVATWIVFNIRVSSSDGLLTGDVIAIGLHQQLSQFKVMATLHLLADVLGVTNHLNKLFQFRDVSFSTLKWKVCGTYYWVLRIFFIQCRYSIAVH